ncbi:MAG: hypothetical protein B6U95_06345, partial [Thermofilum sp. ex4484_82]
MAFVTPFIFISAIQGFKRLLAAKKSFNRIKWLHCFRSVTTNKFLRTLLILVLIFILAFSYVTALQLHVDIPVVKEHDHVIESFLRLIPSNASVLT